MPTGGDSAGEKGAVWAAAAGRSARLGHECRFYSAGLQRKPRWGQSEQAAQKRARGWKQPCRA